MSRLGRAATGSVDGRTVRVWDPYVRVFHWSLVASFAIAWFTSRDWHTLHHWAGYVAAALVTFRLMWGVVGSPHARFSGFVRSPLAVLRFLGAMFRGEEPRYVGHNPAGGAMILALLVATSATAVTGWMMTLDAFWGEAWMETLHATVANVMLGLVVLHVGGVLWASRSHRENLVRAMIVGTKRAEDAGPH